MTITTTGTTSRNTIDPGILLSPRQRSIIAGHDGVNTTAADIITTIVMVVRHTIMCTRIPETMGAAVVVAAVTRTYHEQALELELESDMVVVVVVVAPADAAALAAAEARATTGNTFC